jgi:antitoxin HicB
MFYEIVLEADETNDGSQAFLISIPAFPEVTLFAADKAGAMASAIGGIEEAIAGRMADNENIELPVKNAGDTGIFVEVPLLTALKVSLYGVCRQHNITRAELSRTLGWHREQVDRLFRIDHNSRIDQIEAAFKAVGKPLSFEVLEAA